MKSLIRGFRNRGFLKTRPINRISKNIPPPLIKPKDGLFVFSAIHQEKEMTMNSRKKSTMKPISVTKISMLRTRERDLI
jgi:hypothetical protein